MCGQAQILLALPNWAVQIATVAKDKKPTLTGPFIRVRLPGAFGK